MNIIPTYGWRLHFGVYDEGRFILNLGFYRDITGQHGTDTYFTISIGKFVMTFGKFVHVIVEKD